MSDGLHIRWRETAPDRGLLSFALSELEALHSRWPETVQCNIVIERAPADADARGVQADVELVLGRRSPRVRVTASSDDARGALRQAFGELRIAMPEYQGIAAA